jgi:hypothetical protein
MAIDLRQALGDLLGRAFHGLCFHPNELLYLELLSDSKLGSRAARSIRLLSVTPGLAVGRPLQPRKRLCMLQLDLALRNLDHPVSHYPINLMFLPECNSPDVGHDN